MKDDRKTKQTKPNMPNMPNIQSMQYTKENYQTESIEQNSNWEILTYQKFYLKYLKKHNISAELGRQYLHEGYLPVKVYQVAPKKRLRVGFLKDRIIKDIDLVFTGSHA